MSHRARKVVIGVVVALVVLIVGCAVAAAVFLNAGKASLVGDGASTNAKVIELEGKKYRQNTDVVALCVAGTDSDNKDDPRLNAQADAIMVVAVDTKTNRITCISIPRNTMVDVDLQVGGTFYGTDTLQICLAYAIGSNDDESGKQLCTAVTRLFYNNSVHHYFSLDTTCVDELADAVDGVEVVALEDIAGTDIKEGQTVVLRGLEGEHVSDPNDLEKLWVGGTAAWYLRYRDLTDPDSPTARQARLQQFAKAFAQKAGSGIVRNPGLALSLYDVVKRNSSTDLGLAELAYLTSTVALNSGSIDFVTLDGEMVYNDESEWGQYILDKDMLYRTVLDVYYEPVS